MFSQPLADTPKVSAIVPVWNPGRGIGRCIESLRFQTLEDIEMIFVDDCGTDGAMDMVRAAAKEDPRIRILENSENLGPGISRNNGIDVARGEYLAFIDADDYVNSIFLERLYTKAVADKLDIVKGKIVYEKEDGTIADHLELNETIRNGLDLGKQLYRMFSYQHQSAIYRRGFIKKHNIYYGTSRRGQDDTFLLKVCHKAESFDIEEFSEYFFCERSNSLMHDMHPHTFERRLLAFQEKMDYIVGSMTSEKNLSQYIAGIVNCDLMLCTYYRQKPECRDAAGDFISGLCNQVLRFPQLDKLKRESFVVRVLCDYEVALAQRPFKLPWESRKAEDYVGTVSEWIDFVIEHPDCMNDAETDLYHLFREAFMLCKKENCSDEIKRGLLIQARRLPLRQRILIILVNSPSFASRVVRRMIRIRKGIGTFLKKKGLS
jgi:glycosyltransferase involved in cell wall biosynthesis